MTSQSLLGTNPDAVNGFLGIMGATIVGTLLLVALRRRVGVAEGLLLLGVALARWGNDVW